MKDPFVILRAELVRAAERAALPAPRERWGWLRRRSRPMAIILAALVITGSAAAAVVSLTASASRPLVGRVPGAVASASLAGYGYRIAVSPSLGAGTAGWNDWIVYNRPGRSGYGGWNGAGCGPVWGLGGGGPIEARRGEIVGFVLSGPQVWAVRIGSRTIRTISSPVLPIGARAAVFFIPAQGPIPVDSFAFHHAQGSRRGKHPPRMRRIPKLVLVVPLDRSGRVIRYAQCDDKPPVDYSPPLPWVAPDAVNRQWPLPGFTVPYHAPGFHGRTHPGPGPCELAQHGLPALHAQFGDTIAAILPIRNAFDEKFLSCIDAAYYLHGWPLNVAVLIDARRPGQVLGPIPGARPVTGEPDMVNVATGQFPGSLFTGNFGVTAKRVGKAWLVARGGSGLAQRVQALNALRISKLDLHHLGP
jgi:hypothetical protein